MNHQKSKLIMTAISLVVAFAVVGLATFAWFTLSTNPEIKGIQLTVQGGRALVISKDNNVSDKYEESKNLADAFSAYENQLRPISTVDGKNWFVCTYDAKGDVRQTPIDKGNAYIPQFTYYKFPEGGNVTKGASDNESFYAYTDIYLKTEQESCDVYLSTPTSLSDDHLAYDSKSADGSYHYGSYVLSFQSTTVENGQSQFVLNSQGVETCARVGIRVLGEVQTGDENYGEGYTVSPNNAPLDVKDGETLKFVTGPNVSVKDDFYIYEPNADTRSLADKSASTNNADKYIVGYQATDHNYMNPGYYPTYPVMKKTGQLPSYATVSADGVPTVFPADHLIVQTTSNWKRDPAESEGGEGTAKTTQSFDSTLVGEMGQFLSSEAIYEKNGMNSKTALGAYDHLTQDDYQLIDVSEIPHTTSRLLTLQKDKPVKIRLYFWIEGQDVDCWNDVSRSDFLVNLEFSALEHHE